MTLQFSRVALLVALSVTIYTVMKTFQSLRATDTWSEQGSQFYHGFSIVTMVKSFRLYLLVMWDRLPLTAAHTLERVRVLFFIGCYDRCFFDDV